MIIGVPEVGLVGTIAASYLVDKLQLPELGYIDSDLMPQVLVVHNSKPKQPIRIFGKGKLVIVSSEIPLLQRLAYDVAGEVVRWGKSKGTGMVIGVTGIASRERVEATEDQKPKVLAVTNEEKLFASLKDIGTVPFEEGLLSGTYAMVMKNCMKAGMPNLTLLAEAHLTFPDPGAAAAVIDVLNRLLSLHVGIEPLLQESEEIRLKSRELMAKTNQMMQQTAGEPSPYR
jgi:uncharacterized protein